MRLHHILGTVWCTLAALMTAIPIWLLTDVIALRPSVVPVEKTTIVLITYLLGFATACAFAGIAAVRASPRARLLLRVASVFGLILAAFLIIIGGALLPPLALFIFVLLVLCLHGLLWPLRLP
jgi:hypothetical protein